MIPFSVLDLSPILQGSDPAQSFRNTLDLAQHAEAWGYHRYWLAEHHNLPGVASSATAVVIGHVAGGTKSIRVGSGGIMLPNHAPLIIAEQFGTLASLYPGRIDLGLGRAPGTDQRTAHALRRDIMQAAENFPQDVLELQALLGPVRPNQVIRAVPGADTNVPIWILGSSLFGAELAAMLGLPFAFASHFAPAALMQALELYRSRFEPSAQLAKPYAMVGVGIYAADTDAEARRILTSAQQQFVNLRRGMPTPLLPPVDDMEALWSPMEKVGVERALSVAAVGAPATVERRLAQIIAETGADELMLTGQIYDHRARLRSFEIAAEVQTRLAKA
ncbi:LLM class flavin-dependent oxidoreductase [Desertibaculum subflavum]|uniref:LLM class flavin-dependent oxidoreductase n=1 Tax=Desertibaculum subflavum TaxID=2268458 RepID=UPI000E6714A7